MVKFHQVSPPVTLADCALAVNAHLGRAAGLA